MPKTRKVQERLLHLLTSARASITADSRFKGVRAAGTPRDDATERYRTFTSPTVFGDNRWSSHCPTGTSLVTARRRQISCKTPLVNLILRCDLREIVRDRSRYPGSPFDVFCENGASTVGRLYCCANAFNFAPFPADGMHRSTNSLAAAFD